MHSLTDYQPNHHRDWPLGYAGHAALLLSSCMLAVALPSQAMAQALPQATPQTTPTATTSPASLPSAPRPPVIEALERAKAASARHASAQAAGTTALHLCSGYFNTEMPRPLVDDTARTSGFVLPAPGGTTMVDEQAKTVTVSYSDDMPPRMAVSRPLMGCTLLPIGAGKTMADALPRPTPAVAPRFDDKPWPMGDRAAVAKLPGKHKAALETLIDEAFKDEAGSYSGITWGIVVVKDGKIVAERYQHGHDMHIPARTYSMCKSLSGTLTGLGVQKGLLDIHRKGILAEWRRPGDPRGEITLDNIMHLSSGLYTEAGGDRQNEIYQSGATITETAVANVVDSRPGTRFVYAGGDPILLARALHEAVGDEQAWLTYPYRELLWKVGMTRTFIETDINNDLISSGQCWSTARDFGRLGLLYLGDGMWNGERILPSGWSQYVATPAPAQRPSRSARNIRYGGQFWVYGGVDGLPDDAFSAVGAMGQYAMIVPSQNLVVVRRGYDAAAGFKVSKFAADVIAALGK